MLSTGKQSSGETADPSVPTSIATRRATAKPGADGGPANASGHISLATTLRMAGSPAGRNKLARRSRAGAAASRYAGCLYSFRGDRKSVVSGKSVDLGGS